MDIGSVHVNSHTSGGEESIHAPNSSAQYYAEIWILRDQSKSLYSSVYGLLSACLRVRSHFGSSELTTYLLTYLPSFFFSLVVVVVVVGVELLQLCEALTRAKRQKECPRLTSYPHR